MNNRVPEFPPMYLEYLDQARKQSFFSPMYLGGTSGSSGGVGAPPAGFLGMLIQSRVAYDTTEAATAATTSGSSLLDNLNHIRKRLADIEAGGGGSSGVSGSGVAGRVAYWTSGSVLSSDSTFLYDSATDSLTAKYARITEGLRIGFAGLGTLTEGGLVGESQTLDVYWSLSAVAANKVGALFITSGSNADTYISQSVVGGVTWYSGIDNSDSDKYKVGTNLPGTNTALTLFATALDTIGIGSKIFKLDNDFEVDPTGAAINQVLIYDGSKWIPGFSTGSGSSGGSIGGGGVAGRVAYWTSGSSLGSDSGLLYDATTDRLSLVTSGSASGLLINDTVLYRKSTQLLGIGGGLDVDGPFKIGTRTLTLDSAIELDSTGAVSGNILRFNGTKWMPASSSGSTSGNTLWYNVKDYGAIGNGVANDTAAIASAISALTTGSGGVLYFPTGTYSTTGGFLFTTNAIVMGEGGYWASSTIKCSSATAKLFEVNAASLEVNFQDLYLLNTAATPTAGCAISVGAANGPQVNLTRIVVEKFYDNLDYHSGSNWLIDNCWIGTSRRYGIFIENAFNADQGDWGIINTVITGHTYNPTAAICIESSGGGRIVGCKINGTSTGYAYGILLQVADPTTILLIGNNSIENVRTNGILLANFTSATYSQIIIDGNQFGMYQNGTNAAIIMAADVFGDLKNVVVSNNVFFSTNSPAIAVNIDKMKNVTFSGNIFDDYDNLLQQSNSTGIVVEFAAEVVRDTYTSGVVNMGTSTDSAWGDVDASNISIAITPTNYGKYLVMFTFTIYTVGTSIDEFFRLTDGSTSSHAVEYYRAAAHNDTVTITLQWVFDWSSLSTHTVKLQKYVKSVTSVTVNQLIVQTTGSGGVIIQAPDMTAMRLGS